MSATKSPLAGRSEELALLDEALARAAAGEGCLILVCGEAGIGKSRLCEEARSRHSAGGGHTVFGRAYPEDSDLLLGPVADAVRGARRSRAPLWEAASSRAPVLSAIVPELAAAATEGHGPLERVVVFETVLDAMEEAGGDDAATLWVIDDLHWADESTWELVAYARRRVADMRLVLVATYRKEEIGPAHAWSTRLARLEGEPGVLTLALQRLRRREAERLLGALAPSLPADVAAGVVSRSAGTPLFLEELARLAGRPAGLPAIPEVMRAALRERAERLGPFDRDLLDTAAVAGLDVDVPLLTGLRPDGCIEALVGSGLLVEDDGGVRFHHPLLQEAAYDHVPADRRVALHVEVANALSSQGHHVVERAAVHLERAGAIEAALAEVMTAASGARASGAVGRAASLDLAALALVRRHALLAGRRDELLGVAVGDLFRAGRWTELDPLIRNLWTERDRLAPTERARLAGMLALHLFWSGAIPQAHVLVEVEVANLHGDDIDAAALLLAQAAFIAWFEGRPNEALRHARRALEGARRLGDIEVECRARNVLTNATYAMDRDRAAAADAHRANAALASAHGLGVAEANALWSLSHFTTSHGDYDAARRAAEHAGTWYVAPTRLVDAYLHVVEGRPDEAEHVIVEIGPQIRLGIPAMAAWMDIVEAWLLLHRGQTERARRLLEERDGSPRASLVVWDADQAAVCGWLEWEEGRLQEASAHLERCAAACRAGAYHVMVGGPVLLPLQVDALLRLGLDVDAAAAAAGARAAHPVRHRLFDAALAAAQLRLQPSPETALAAEAAAATAPWPWLLALVTGWRGALLKDPAAGARARDMFEELGARRGVERAEAVMRRLGAGARVRERGGGRPTERELEVARLVADGMSNPAIARRLFLSRPTVASHVAHMLDKLGLSSRAQIAAWVTTFDSRESKGLRRDENSR